MQIDIKFSFRNASKFDFNDKSWLILVDDFQIIKTLIVINDKNNAKWSFYLLLNRLQNFELVIDFQFDFELFFSWWLIFCHYFYRSQLEWSKVNKKDSFDKAILKQIWSRLNWSQMKFFMQWFLTCEFNDSLLSITWSFSSWYEIECLYQNEGISVTASEKQKAAHLNEERQRIKR